MDVFSMVVLGRICPICKEKLVGKFQMYCDNCEILWKWVRIEEYLYWKEKLKKEN